MATPLISPALKRLYGVCQQASTEVGGGLTELGFLDLAVVGMQSAGKSSVLTALCGVGLPSGNNTVTRSPIRLRVQPGRTQTAVVWPNSVPPVEKPLPGGNLDNKTYKDALSAMGLAPNIKAGEFCTFTRDELQVMVSAGEDDPPFCLVDLPGLYYKDDPAKLALEGMVKSYLQAGDSSAGTLLPVLVMKAGDDLANTPASLLKRRPFVTVVTNLDALKTDKGRMQQCFEQKRELESQGCKGYFFVQAPDGIEVPQAYETMRHTARQAPALDYAALRALDSSCGVAQLQAHLQLLQQEHLERNHLEIKNRLETTLRDIRAKLQTCPNDPDAAMTQMQAKLAYAQQDLEDVVYNGKWRMLPGAPENPQHELSAVAKVVLDAFSQSALRAAIEDVSEAWRSTSAQKLKSNTRLSSWRLDVWNLISTGLLQVADAHRAGMAMEQLLSALKAFVMWRIEQHLEGESSAVVSDFLDVYLQAKREHLLSEFALAQEELRNVVPSTYAPWLYWMLEGDEAQVQSLQASMQVAMPSFLEKTLASMDVPLVMDQGKQYQQEFGREGQLAQKRSMLLTFFIVTELVESLSRRIFNIVLARSYRLPRDPVAQSSLAFSTLQNAFPIWVRGTEGTAQKLLHAVAPNAAKWSIKEQSMAAMLEAINSYVTDKQTGNDYASPGKAQSTSPSAMGNFGTPPQQQEPPRYAHMGMNGSGPQQYGPGGTQQYGNGHSGWQQQQQHYQ